MHNEQLKDDHLIFAACRNGDVETVEKFLNQGISVRADSPRNPTLMSCATGEGQLEVVKLMVNRGIDVKEPLPGVGGGAPIFLALGYNRHELVDYFFEMGTRYDISDDYGVQPIMCAAGAGNLGLIKRILEAGIDVDVFDSHGKTPLVWAARANQIPALEILLSHGADIEKQDCDKKTALIHVAQRGKLEAIQWLLDHGADILAEEVESVPVFLASKKLARRIADGGITGFALKKCRCMKGDQFHISCPGRGDIPDYF